MSSLEFVVIYCLLCGAVFGTAAGCYAIVHKIACDKADKETKDGE